MAFLQGASAVGSPDKHFGVVKKKKFPLIISYVSVVDITVYTQVIIPVHIPSLDDVSRL